MIEALFLPITSFNLLEERVEVAEEKEAGETLKIVSLKIEELLTISTLTLCSPFDLRERLEKV